MILWLVGHVNWFLRFEVLNNRAMLSKQKIQTKPQYFANGADVFLLFL